MGRVVQRVAPAHLKEAAPRVQQRVVAPRVAPRVAQRVAQRVAYFRRAPFMADLTLLVTFLIPVSSFLQFRSTIPQWSPQIAIVKEKYFIILNTSLFTQERKVCDGFI